ncbi:MAG: biosynthetic arginine decarboxylase [Gammaproteobacteria bacterium]|nr:biosynthetic arginine decarboxylase [Gammaproteobacteria bacterium]
MSWKIQNARDTYNISHWSGGYFDVADNGHLVAHPGGASGPGIDMQAVADSLHQQGLGLPTLVRFSGILRHRVNVLCDAFVAATNEHKFTGGYTAVYPIKVNQQRSVVEEIVGARPGSVGLEAGSKPELLAVLAHSDPDGGLVVCNGHKDREFIRLALIGQALGHKVHIVIERLSELELVIEQANTLTIRPLLGLRLRLASIGEGHWQNTGGEKSKFGLSADQVQTALHRLQQIGWLDCLSMLHCHMGSQIANIRHVQSGVAEAARYYAEIRQFGADVKYVNVGGGLGIDYDGTSSRSYFSANYSVEQYASAVVKAFAETSRQHGMPDPHVVTESGRAMTAHHAVLISNVLDVEHMNRPRGLVEPDDSAAPVLRELWQAHSTVNMRTAIEHYHNAAQAMDEVRSLFTEGKLGLKDRALAENLYRSVCMQTRDALNSDKREHRQILDELNEQLADKYFCNLSVFQSLPDVWAINQIFPIVPLARLDEAPERRGVIVDVTCDSDGRIDTYVDANGVESTLPLHEVQPDERYLLGIFLVGAYQEILGDMHNLFGDTHSAHIELNDDGSYRIDHTLHGDTVDYVLRFVHFEPEQLKASYVKQVEGSTLNNDQRKQYLDELVEGLSGYTYLEE